MDIQKINHHLHAMQNSAERQAMDSQRTGNNGMLFLDAFRAQQSLLILMCEEINALQKEVATLKEQQTPSE